MKPHALSQEQRILIALRKTLAEVVKDTTPLPGRRHPLKERTIERIRDCFSLIAARERELLAPGDADGADGAAMLRPRYADAPQTPNVVPLKRARGPHDKIQNKTRDKAKEHGREEPEQR